MGLVTLKPFDCEHLLPMCLYQTLIPKYCSARGLAPGANIENSILELKRKKKRNLKFS